jgi:demethylmenaquinone methyltransferase/2-methoxy-6-polyprenyl-1,4-benzoquinol methylase
MRSAQLPQIFEEVYRVIKPGGLFILVDFPLTNPVFWAGFAVFLWLFETETDLGSLLAQVGWRSYNSEEDQQPKLYAGGNIQVIQVQKSYQIRQHRRDNHRGCNRNRSNLSALICVYLPVSAVKKREFLEPQITMD